MGARNGARSRGTRASVPRISDQRVREVLSRVCDGRVSRVLDGHLVHSFPARMPLAVAEYLIRELTAPQHVVLDPMMGSGTTPIAAKRLGRDAFGFDLDPLAVTLAKGLLHCGTARSLKSSAAAILVAARRLASRSAPSAFSEEDRSFVHFWFPSQSQIQLSALARAIREESTAGAQSFFWSVYSSLILVKSAGPSFAMDLARSRPHRVFDKPVVMPFEAWMSKSLKAIERKDRLWGEKPRSRCVVRQGDARKLSLQGGAVDFVLTSPPISTASTT